MDHTAVVTGLMGRHLPLFFEDDYLEAWMLSQQLQPDGKTNDSGPDNRDIATPFVLCGHSL